MEYNYPFTELVGLLTVNQIKEVLLPKNEALKSDIQKIEHDVDTLINEKGLKLSARFVRLVIYLAQLDLHIWYCKDQMAEHPTEYTHYMTKAHQVNGIRNKVKNLISEYAGDSPKHTNDSPDGLDWELSI